MPPDTTPPTPSFVDAWAGLRAQDQDAARRVYERFVNQLIAIAAKRLNCRATVADPESIAHSVFESFFAGVRKGKFEFRNWAAVLGLLAHITFKKCYHRVRDANRVKRSPGAKVYPLEDWEAVGRSLGPDEEAIMKDLLETALRDFDDDDRTVIQLYLEGHSTEVVAYRTNFTRRSVQRTVEEFRDHLESLTSDD
jgi:RNA polymerase sigma factor (sigma-70 family)